jgi:replication-associated recombination protein RarA
MVAHHADDPWTLVTTVGGLHADEVISTLQKSIRRGDVRTAVLCAAEMSATSDDLDNYLWDRLHVIAVEDIGFAAPAAVTTIVALDTARRRFQRGTHDRLLFAVHAVRLLAESAKDRSNDELANVVLLDVADGVKPEIPDYALDMHTRRGQEMGRDLAHFLTEGAKIEPELAGRDRRWRVQLLERLGLEPDPA